MTLIYFGRQLPAVLACHGSLKCFEDHGRQRVVVGERFCAIVHSHACTLTQELVMRAFVGILEPPPTAHVIHEHSLEIGFAIYDGTKEFLKPSSPPEI